MKKVYIVYSSGTVDCEPFHSILGVYEDLGKAKEVMSNDILDIKKKWEFIDFFEPEGWEVTLDEDLCYKGYTPYDDYSYQVCIEEWEVE